MKLLAFDAAAVLVFVIAGRASHEEGLTLSGVATTALPFLIALSAGWLFAAAWREPEAIRTGVIVWPSTVVIGMLLRRFVFDDGVALSFVIVASIVLGVLVVGWRIIASF